MSNNGRKWAAIAGFSALVGSLTTTPGFGCGGDVDGTATSGTPGGTGGGGAGGGDTTLSVGSSTGTGVVVECPTPCQMNEVCSHGVCVPKQETCKKDDECVNDTYCDPASGCQPWEGKDPANDPTCINVIAAGILSPKVKCEFSQAPPGDPFPNHVDVQGTPIVVNFNGFEQPPDSPEPIPVGTPSIAASFTATVVANYTEELGVIRVLSGKDCSLEANLGGTDLDNDGVIDYTVSSATLAAGDLDGDKKAEIVALGADGSILAFTRKNGQWGLLWKLPHSAGIPGGACNPVNHRCPLGWSGPSIHDLDNDGVPEILREGAVISAAGVLIAGAPAGYASYLSGAFPIAANLDQDPAIEFTNGQFIWEWQAGGWMQEPSFPGGSPSAPGHVAVADFGAYGSGVPANNPEIAVVRNSTTMVYAITGELVQPPIAVPGAGGGGPPTISDFDNDGLAELAVAGQAFYTIYDIDCGPNPRPNGKCSPGVCDFLGVGEVCAAGSGIAWSRSTQDLSSNITGSSIFDFEADGNAEVVYGDECFVRVYNGVTGDVLFSQYRSSCTWYENPIIADVDGNFRADLVTPSNKACSASGDGILCQTLDQNGVDPQFPGLRCETNADCVSGACESGFCRCTTSAQCCGAMDDAACLEEGFKCAPPPAGTPGAGDT
ncbi:MAG: VCBS repeat-containing protein, partial [Polyangiaceae bacterium]|nr:VCBS repeat-containing protein [Polyangiaceae bacterium]